MNIRAEPGLSCSVYRLDTYGPLISRRKLREFWWAYVVGGDQAYDLTRFIHLTRAGRVMHFEVLAFDRPQARFGIEYSHDHLGPYITVLYLEGQWLREYVHHLAWTLLALARSVVPEGVKPRCKIKGRKGWPRFLRQHGIKINHNDMVSGWQPYFQAAPDGWKREYDDG
jgi:hypothetical protein